MNSLPYKHIQEQLVVSMVMMVLEESMETDFTGPFKTPCFYTFTKDPLFMSSTLDVPSSLTDSALLNKFIDQALQQSQAQHPKRSYLGASRLGEACARALQYEYTHTPKDRDYSGQTLRIFEMGHALEKMAWQWLQQAGFVIERVDPTNGQAYGFSGADGQLQGHADGVIRKVPEGLAGLKDISLPALWECKSLNAKSFKQLVEKGLKIAKPVYAVQIALYQAYLPDLHQHPALLTAVNKDTAELYHEWVEFDASLAQAASDKAVHILRATRVGETLPRVSTDPEHFNCRFCDWQSTCWKGDESCPL